MQTCEAIGVVVARAGVGGVRGDGRLTPARGAFAIRDRYDAYLPKTTQRVEVELKLSNLQGTEAFSAMMMNAETILAELLEKARAVKAEKNRAAVATLNAEVRRGKNYLRGEVPKLRKIAKTKASGVTADDVRAMLEIVDELETRVESVSDGVTRALPPQRKPNPSGGYGGPSVAVNIDPNVQPGSSSNPFVNMEHSETSKAFRMEFEERKKKQDAGLDAISRGLGVLKDIGGEMTEEMRRQEPITDAIEEKLDSANRDIRTANAKLKHAVMKMRSTRKFCVDIILICVVLGIALTLFKTLA